MRVVLEKRETERLTWRRELKCREMGKKKRN